mgnify:CR=1 FL=1
MDESFSIYKRKKSKYIDKKIKVKRVKCSKKSGKGKPCPIL